MRFRNLTSATALVAALMMTIGGALAFDDSKYPDLKASGGASVPYRTHPASASPSILASRSVKSNHR
jgi:hypothetical protein